jgi:hypothetical protein
MLFILIVTLSHPAVTSPLHHLSPVYGTGTTSQLCCLHMTCWYVLSCLSIEKQTQELNKSKNRVIYSLISSNCKDVFLY